MEALVAVMEDEHGEAVTLQLFHQEEEEARKATDVMDVGTVMIVKEPFFKMMGDGTYGVRVDHLSDVVTLYGHDERIPGAWQPWLTELDISDDSFKIRGNEAMGKGRYRAAIH
jgi:hypothetical protein